ncbi:SDR family oxidoreductase [Terrabacter sp. MAHUQ-38]|jgi:uncharacterized protein YbjT (DUF2867 family)|uniref:SDR family oxidoreductase n=1 Tax=unclassified Terrabacter TaxID=2630222 RepID=UPI00165D3EC9|nr:NAD(P)H-binding protein [Terrabacter sp. MAHUQ-38]MBC9820043.1 NAD(P)H-binding protein [Terrabacter sp. MAHUQ-38]
MTSRILITGGTGTLGRHVTPLLVATGADVRVLSRAARETTDGTTPVRGDLETGEGVDAAVAGADTIVHLAGSAKGDGIKAQTLVRAARSAGSPHLVYISVVGAERIPVVSRMDRMAFGYFASKRAAEVVVEQSGLPWTTLRATQFHDLALTTVQALAKSPLMPYFAGVRFQPVDTAEVARRLVDLALAPPAGLVDEMGGPEVHEMRHLAKTYLEASGKRRLLVPMRVAGRSGRAVRAGANLTPGHAVGRRTWAEFLDEHAR